MNDYEKCDIILASASPRRAELFSRIFDDFAIIPAEGEEKLDETLTPEQNVCRLAAAKCDEVYLKNRGSLVVGCDTIVVYDGKIYGKPKNKREAEETLRLLSGKVHEVITGVCVRSPNGKWVDREVTEVRFNELSDDFIRSYVDGGSPLDKAGSYGIQDDGVVKEYCGSYTNVVGLPVALVKKIVEELL